MKFFALKINPIFFSPPLFRGEKEKEPPTVFEARSRPRLGVDRRKKKKERESTLDLPLTRGERAFRRGRYNIREVVGR